jgi:hypothetical protein
MDALDRTAINGLLDLFCGSPGGIIDFREVFIVQAEDLRADFGTESARNTFILVDHGNLSHETPPSLSLKDLYLPFQ